jgi:hypothetical protein
MEVGAKSLSSLLALSRNIMVRSTPTSTPLPLHPDDLSAFGSSMAVWHLSYHLGVIDWAAVDDVNSQLPYNFLSEKQNIHTSSHSLV